MIIWLLIFGLFGLVAYEQMSIVPLAIPVVMWVVAWPIQHSLTRTIKRGGKGVGCETIVFVLLMIPLFLVVLSTWRGQ